jgi:hypothetical protein
VTPRLYASVRAARQCDTDLDATFCILGRFIIDRPIWDAVKADNCTLSCYSGPSLVNE